MDIKEFFNYKQTAEAEIRDFLNQTISEFEKETGFAIRDFDIDMVNVTEIGDTGWGRFIVSDVTVKIDI